MGEENSKFFQAMAIERNRNNSIASLVMSNGSITSDHEEMAKAFLNSFKARMGTVLPITLEGDILS